MRHIKNIIHARVLIALEAGMCNILRKKVLTKEDEAVMDYMLEVYFDLNEEKLYTNNTHARV